MTELKVVGKSIPRMDTLEKVTGKAKFCSDFKVHGMLHAKVLTSPHPHARIVSIDTSRAKKLPGVRAVLEPKDVPPISIASHVADQYPLCRDHIVRCVGDAVAAVAADTEMIAEDALELIDVHYEELPAVFDAEEAMKKEPPVIVHPDFSHYKPTGALQVRPDPERPNVCQVSKVLTGDLEKGFQEADLIVENRFSTARIQHCPMEPHQSSAWLESDGSLTVRSAGQSPYMVKSVLCRLFNLSPSKVRVLSPYIGGGFGAKGSVLPEPIAALLAQKSGRPVSLILTREEMFTFGRHRIPMIFDIKDGVKRDGTILAREMRAILALGPYLGTGVSVVMRTPAGATGTYRIPNFKIVCYGVYTNDPITGSFRGFGAPEIQWAIEGQMDIIAEKLGIDPVELRKKNTLREGERDAGGQITHSIGVNQCLDSVAKWIGWGERPIEEKGPWKRGKGIAIGNKSIQAGTSSVAVVKVWQDGVIEVRHSTGRLGQGPDTALAQMAAEEFGVAIDQVRVVTGDTAFCPYDFGTLSSRSLHHVGNALLSACQDAKRRLFEMAAPKLGVTPEDLATSEGKIYVKAAPERWVKITDLFAPTGVPLKGGEILGAASYTGPLMPADPKTGQSERYVTSFSYGANAAEVAVNEETGEVKLLRIAGAFDVGTAINPKIVEQQIDGGIGQGIGSAIYEQVVVDKGKVVNASFMDYRIPGALDMPNGEGFKSMIASVPHRDGPFGAKGVAELTMVATAPAIANAVYNAIGVRIKDLPISKDKVVEGITAVETLSQPIP